MTRICEDCRALDPQVVGCYDHIGCHECESTEIRDWEWDHVLQDVQALGHLVTYYMSTRKSEAARLVDNIQIWLETHQ